MGKIIQDPPTLDGTSGWGFISSGHAINFSSKVVLPGRITLSSVWMTNVQQFGSNPVDNVILSIYKGGTNPQNGSLLKTISVPAASVPVDNGMSSVAQYTVFDLDVPLVLSGGVYFFTLTRTGSYSSPVGFYSVKSGPTIDSTTKWSSSTGTWVEDASRSIGITLYGVGFNEYIQITQLSMADPNGNVQTINAGKSDNGAPIFYELETQELEFGERSHLKKISDRIGTLNEFDTSSLLQGKAEDNDYQEIPIAMNDNVNIGKNINLEGHFFTFKWSGSALTNSPVFDGLYIESVEDQGITK